KSVTKRNAYISSITTTIFLNFSHYYPPVRIRGSQLDEQSSPSLFFPVFLLENGAKPAPFTNL
ncbi:hypothetical protein ACQUJK_002826, partial [Enterococcus hirae]